MSESQANGGHEPNRSRPPFDPLAGMRAVADIQAEGLRAASDLLERILRSEPDAPDARPRSGAGGMSALVEAWTDLLQRTVAALGTAPGEPGAVTVAIDASGAGPQVRLAVDETSAGDATEVWLHNGTLSAVGPLALRCGPLSDADGTVLEGDVRFEPHEVELLPARSSRAVVVSVVAAEPLRPGTYRGTIQAHGAPRLWLALEVVVAPC